MMLILSEKVTFVKLRTLDSWHYIQRIIQLLWKDGPILVTVNMILILTNFSILGRLSHLENHSQILQMSV